LGRQLASHVPDGLDFHKDHFETPEKPIQRRKWNLIVQRGEHGNAPLHPVRLLQVRCEHDEADEVGGVTSRAEDSPAVGRLIHRAGVGGRLNDVRLSLRLEPDNRGARKQHLGGARIHTSGADAHNER